MDYEFLIDTKFACFCLHFLLVKLRFFFFLLWLCEFSGLSFAVLVFCLFYSLPFFQLFALVSYFKLKSIAGGVQEGAAQGSDAASQRGPWKSGHSESWLR